MSDVWICDGCKEDFDTEEKALEHEKTCQEALVFVKNAKLREMAIEKESKLMEEAYAEERRLRKEQEKRRREEEIFLKNKLLEEENELGSFTYASRHSENRFPYHIWYISVIRTVAGIILVLGFFGFLIVASQNGGSEEGVVFGLFILLWSAIAAFFTMLGSEIIRLLLDFHDNNHINTKIRVKTLEALETISDKLKK